MIYIYLYLKFNVYVNKKNVLFGYKNNNNN